MAVLSEIAPSAVFLKETALGCINSFSTNSEFARVLGPPDFESLYPFPRFCGNEWESMKSRKRLHPVNDLGSGAGKDRADGA
jgi:hypothetical protein